MTQNTRPDPFFLADNAALDFLNSIAAPHGQAIEWIANGDDLLAWLDKAGLVKGDVLRAYRESSPAADLDAVAEKARDLREWFRKFIVAHAGQRPGPSLLPSLDKLNRMLGSDAVYRKIIAGADQSLTLGPYRRWDNSQSLLHPLAEAMAELICQPDFERIKNCEGPTCTVWFLDVSKNHTRRWCAMQMCGNRAKAAAHRARKKQK